VGQEAATSVPSTSQEDNNVRIDRRLKMLGTKYVVQVQSGFQITSTYGRSLRRRKDMPTKKKKSKDMKVS
jgi:hypothetical protein